MTNEREKVPLKILVETINALAVATSFDEHGTLTTSTKIGRELAIKQCKERSLAKLGLTEEEVVWTINNL